MKLEVYVKMGIELMKNLDYWGGISNRNLSSYD
jgi:hypothetical protein